MKYLIDLDGTILDGGLAVNHSAEFLARLHRDGTEFLIMTNSIRSPARIAERLNAAGINLDERRILNPIMAINRFIAEKGLRTAFVLGSKDEKAQLCVDTAGPDVKPELLVLLDFEKENVSYADLQTALGLIESGTETVAASYSDYYRKNGRRRLDTGAFVKLLEHASGKSIRILGKPAPEYFEIARKKLEAETGGVTVVGDDWSTDIAGAKAAGFSAVLVRSGKYVSGDESLGKPDKVVDDLMELL